MKRQMILMIGGLLLGVVLGACGPSPTPSPNASPTPQSVFGGDSSKIEILPTTAPSAAATSAPTVAPTVAPTRRPTGSSRPPETAGSVTDRQSTSFEKDQIQTVEVPVKTDYKFFYFSYDDSASTAGVELTKNALKNNTLPLSSWARPWEFLNFEHFDRVAQDPVGLFQVAMGIWEHPDLLNPQKQVYELGVHVSAPKVTRDERRNVVLTLVIHLSERNLASRGDPDPLAMIKTGLLQMEHSLKPGDRINLVLASPQGAVLLEDWAYTESSSFFRLGTQGLFNPAPTQRPLAGTESTIAQYRERIQALTRPTQSDLGQGIAEAYRLATQYFEPGKLNRVLLLTDSLVSESQLDVATIAKQTQINNQEGIYFSAVGVGEHFEDRVLNQISEAGSGAYFTMLNQEDASRIFNERFIALVDVAARQVQFRLDYPPGLKRKQSAAESSSTEAKEVPPTNFSYNTSQFFWEAFASEQLLEDVFTEEIQLVIIYNDLNTHQKKAEIYGKTIGSLLNQQTDNIKDAHLVVLLNSLIKGDVLSTTAQQELAQLFSTHTTSLGGEYQELIQTWIKLKNGE